MKGTGELIGSILVYCDEHPVANLALQVATVVVFIFSASFVLTIAVPILFIVVLLIGKFCVPISVAIFNGLMALLHL